MPTIALACALATAMLIGLLYITLCGAPRVRRQPGQFISLLAQPTSQAPSAALASGSEDALRTRDEVPGPLSGEPGGSSQSVVAEESATALLGATIMGAEWQTLDGHIFDAFAQLTHEQVHGFWDLSQVVDAHHYDLANEHFTSMLAGHVAEFHVRDHLTSAGVHVVMPHASNFAGLDLFANGSPFNVKDYADATTVLHEHFGHYPNIGVVLNGDATHLPHDALHFDAAAHLGAHALGGHSVLVDDSLSHAAMQAHTDHAMHLLAQHGGAAHAFPVASFIVSGIREGRLIAKGHTDVARAAKNVATDGVIRGGSIMAGAKAGALAGGIVGPHGAIIGAIVGAVGAGFAGGAVAKNVREQPLLEARNAYDAQARKLATLSTEVERSTQASWKQYQDTEQSRLQTRLDRIEADSARQRERAAQALARSHQLSPTDAARVLAEPRDQFDSLLAARKADLPQGRVGLGILRPHALVKYLVTRHDHHVWSRQAEELVGVWQNDRDPAPIFDQALALPIGHRLAEAYVRHVNQTRADAVRVLGAITQRSVTLAAQERANVVGRLKQKLDDLVAEARKKLEPATDLLVGKGELLKEELLKAGLTSG